MSVYTHFQSQCESTECLFLLPFFAGLCESLGSLRPQSIGVGGALVYLAFLDSRHVAHLETGETLAGFVASLILRHTSVHAHEHIISQQTSVTAITSSDAPWKPSVSDALMQ